jgi:hypothetical protein
MSTTPIVNRLMTSPATVSGRSFDMEREREKENRTGLATDEAKVMRVGRRKRGSRESFAWYMCG